MREAYAGMPEPQQLALGQSQLGTSMTQKDIAHRVVDYLGENFGYGTVLLILAVGAVVLYKKRIKAFLKGESNGK